MAETQDCYVIGIDFGTTFSGVAWSWSGDPDEINLVTRWNRKSNASADDFKIPTEIYYGTDPKNPDWGYEISPSVEPIRWFKLLLVDEKDLESEMRDSVQIKRARSMIGEKGKTVVDVVADYLRLLWGTAKADIELSQPRGFLAYPFKVWITVPAIWKENAKEAMRAAARKAGILDYREAGDTTLALVAEPEAAATAVLDDLRKWPHVKEGDVYTICDAGGGTVDLISYEILQTNPMTVKECVEGAGKLCGGVFIDYEFESLVKGSLTSSQWGQLSATGRNNIMYNGWELLIKRVFSDTGKQQEWNLQVPFEVLRNSRLRYRQGDSRRGDVAMKDGNLKIKREHIVAVFQKVVPSICYLIEDQIRKVEAKRGHAPKEIMLVGGLGASRYLGKEVKERFSAKNIETIQLSGAKPQTAICRGAVMRGLSELPNSPRKSLVLARVSRVSYGTDSMEPYKEGTHHPDDKIWDSQELVFKAKNQMNWYLNRGEDLSTQEPVKLGFYVLYKNPPSGSKMEPIQIFENYEDRAPPRMTEKVTPLVEISTRITLPFGDFPEYKNRDGEKFRKIEYELQMDSDGVTIKWKVFINGELQGSKDMAVIPSVKFEEPGKSAISKVLESQMKGMKLTSAKKPFILRHHS